MCKKITSILIILCFVLISKLYAKSTLLDKISSIEEYSKFYELIKKANYEELFENNYKFKKIVYIPDNQAFDDIPGKLKELIWTKNNNSLAKKIVKSHFYSDSIKTVFKDPRKKVTVIERIEFNNELIRIYSNSDLFVKDMVEERSILDSKEFTIVPVGCVMFIQPSFSDNRLNDKQKDESLITSCCLLTDEEIIALSNDYNY